MAVIMSQVLGHDLQKSRLSKTVAADRVPSSLIFVGPSGIGKKLVALSLAQQLLCETGQPACGECGSCLRVENKQSESLKIIEPTKGTIKIDQAREAISFIHLKSEAKHRVIIIDEADKLNPQASNALLKSIEEPPPGVHFILITESLMALLPTLRSRSQVFRFSPLEDNLVAQITGASGWVVKSSQGRVVQAEDLMSESMTELRTKSMQYWKALLNQRQTPLEILKQIEDDIKSRENSLYLVKFWQQFIRDVYLMQLGSKDQLNQDSLEMVKEWSEATSPELIAEISEMLFVLESELRSNADKMLSFESFSIQAQESLFGECRV